MVARPSRELALSYYRLEAQAESACSSCTRASPGGTCLPLVLGNLHSFGEAGDRRSLFLDSHPKAITGSTVG